MWGVAFTNWVEGRKEGKEDSCPWFKEEGGISCRDKVQPVGRLGKRI